MSTIDNDPNIKSSDQIVSQPVESGQAASSATKSTTTPAPVQDIIQKSASAPPPPTVPLLPDAPKLVAPRAGARMSISDFTELLGHWASEGRKVDEKAKILNIEQSIALHEQRLAVGAQVKAVITDVFGQFVKDLQLGYLGDIISKTASSTYNAAVEIWNGTGAMFKQVGVALNTSLRAVENCAQALWDALGAAAISMAQAPAAAVKSFLSGAGDLVGNLISGKVKPNQIQNELEGMIKNAGNAAKAKCDAALAALNTAIDKCNAQRTLFLQAQDEFIAAGKEMDKAVERARKIMGSYADDIKKRNDEVKQKYGDNLFMLVAGLFPDFKKISIPEFQQIGPAIGKVFGEFKVDLNFKTQNVEIAKPLVANIAGTPVTLFPGLSLNLPVPKLNVNLPSLSSLANLGSVTTAAFTALGKIGENIGKMFLEPWERYAKGVINPVMNTLTQFIKDSDLLNHVLQKERAIPAERPKMAELPPGQKAVLIAMGVSATDIDRIQKAITEAVEKQRKEQVEKANSTKQANVQATEANAPAAARFDKALGGAAMDAILKNETPTGAADAHAQLQLLTLALAGENTPVAISQSAQRTAEVNEGMVQNHQLPLAADDQITQSIIATSQAETKVALTDSVTQTAAKQFVEDTPALAAASPEEQAEMQKAVQALMNLLLMLMSGADVVKGVPPGQLKKLISRSLEGASKDKDPAAHETAIVRDATSFKSQLVSSYKAQRPGIPENHAQHVAEQAVQLLFGVSLEEGKPKLPAEHKSILSTLERAIGDLSEVIGSERTVKTMEDFLKAETDVTDFTGKVVEKAKTMVSLMSTGIVKEDDRYKPELFINI